MKISAGNTQPFYCLLAKSRIKQRQMLVEMLVPLSTTDITNELVAACLVSCALVYLYDSICCRTGTRCSSASRARKSVISFTRLKKLPSSYTYNMFFTVTAHASLAVAGHCPRLQPCIGPGRDSFPRAGPRLCMASEKAKKDVLK